MRQKQIDNALSCSYLEFSEINNWDIALVGSEGKDGAKVLNRRVS